IIMESEREVCADMPLFIQGLFDISAQVRYIFTIHDWVHNTSTIQLFLAFNCRTLCLTCVTYVICRKQVFWISKQILQLVMEDAIDDWILRQINWLRRDEVIIQGIRWIQDTLWPNGVFFTKLDGYQGNAGSSQFDKHPSGSADETIGNRKSNTSSFELQLEASRNASEVKKLLLGGTPSTLVSIIGYKQYQRSARDIYYFLQSTVCVKQLTYAMIEQVLVTLFPELHKLIEGIHEKGRKEQASFIYQL
uniref:Sorting nexin C-terminal domain-containing protein n=1 Tax=Aegilops tauschii subsp. strangulata TaxID=200361 RepID=A0A453HMY5_AEGTS